MPFPGLNKIWNRVSGSNSKDCVTGNHTFPAYPKYGKNHLGEFFFINKGCFGYGQMGYKLCNCLSIKHETKGNKALSTISATIIGHPLNMVLHLI